MVPRVARAEDPRLTIEVLTDLPLGIGAGADVELGPRLRFGLSALYLPAAYVELSDSIAQAVGGYDEVTSGLVRAATENALSLRARAGVRPLADHGFYVDATYSVLSLGGALTADDLGSASGAGAGSQARWEVGSTVHQIGLELGWRFRLPLQLALRLALGGSFTVAADVSAEPRNPRFPRLAELARQAGETYLADVFRSYVHLPVVTVALGRGFPPSK